MYAYIYTYTYIYIYIYILAYTYAHTHVLVYNVEAPEVSQTVWDVWVKVFNDLLPDKERQFLGYRVCTQGR